MIKNNLLKGVVLLSVLLSFSSCKQSPFIENSVVDLRNYDSDGEIYSGSRNVSKNEEVIEFSAELTDERWNFYRYGEYYGGSDCPQWVKDTITIEDSENGIKVVYHRPDVDEAEPFMDKPISWFGIEYIDGNGNVSTSTKASGDNINDFFIDDSGNNQSKAKETFSLEYPLLLPGKRSIICVEYGYDCGADNPNQFAINFAVMPVHGKGCVKDLEKNFVSEGEINPLCIKYTILEDTDESLNLTIKDVIPPEGTNLRISYQVIEQDADTSYYDLNWNSIGWTEEEVTTPSETFTVDLTKYEAFSNSKNKPYLFAQFGYSYELDEFPGMTFTTPGFKSAIIKSDKFYK